MNPNSLKALTWGTVVTALFSALLLAAAGGVLPDHPESHPQPAGGAPAGAQRQNQVGARATASQHTPAGVSAAGPH